MDGQFARSIDQLKLDLDGLLVEKLLLTGSSKVQQNDVAATNANVYTDIFERFAQPWLEAVLVWIEACSMVDDCMFITLSLLLL